MTGYVLESNRVAGTRLELLLFRLSGRQRFGINVFKVQEIIPFSRVRPVPGAHHLVSGIASLRGIKMTIMDLSLAIGGRPLADPHKANIIITEYNRSVHGFLVNAVDRIVNARWEDVQAPPARATCKSFVTAVTIINDELIEILDVEKVLDQMVQASTHVSNEVSSLAVAESHRVLVIDDSSVARRQVQRALAQIGVDCVTVADGSQALQALSELAAQGEDMSSYFSMVISDIEMPGMDGYMLARRIRALPGMEDAYILLHSSISGQFNEDMIRKTGVNQFIQKYSPDDLANAVLKHIAAL